VTIEEFLSRLEGVRQVSDGSWMALCPAHDDRNPSLSIQLADDRILIHCFAGCSPQTVVRAMGLEMKDLFLEEEEPFETGPGVLQAAYVYRDEHGNPLYRVLRYHVPGEKKKTFRQQAWDPKTGTWKGGKGALGQVRRVLYRLPELVKADREKPVWLCEGEKDVDHLRAYGLVATTNVGGAKAWRADYNRFFVGRTVYILKDNDPDGEQRCSQLAEELEGIADTVKIVDLPGLGPKEDVSDWLLRGHSVEELLDIAENTPAYKPKTSPVLKGEVGLFALEWPDLGIQAEAEVLSESYGDFYILLSIYAFGKKILPPTKVNILSLSTRARLAKGLEEKHALGMWDAIIDNLATRILNQRTEAEPLEVITAASQYRDTQYLVHPILPVCLPTILYGDGESGKTLTSILLGILVSTGKSLPWLGLRTQSQGPVLYLDYEGNQDVFTRRLVFLSRGLGTEPVIHYLRCSVPLAQDFKRVAKHVMEVDPALIVVDSAALAALPGAKDPLDTVKSIFNPLSQLGRTSLVIAHTPKEKDSVYGSIFFRNLARSVWYAQAYQTVEDNFIDVVLTHNKSNEDRHFPPIGLRFSFLQDRIIVKRSNPSDVPGVNLSTEEEILAFLKRHGAHAPKDIAAELGKNPGTVRKCLQRMLGANKVVKLGDGRYGLPLSRRVPEREPDVVPF